MIYLFISIFIFSLLFVVFKLFEVFKINTLQAIIVNYLTAALLGFSLSDISIPFLEIPGQPWFFGALFLGVLFIVVFMIMALTSQRNGLSVASVAGKMSVVIPVIFGLIVYKESTGFLKIFGIILALFAVYFTSLKSENSPAKAKNMLLPFLLFLGTGCIDTLLKYVETLYVPEGGVPMFSATIFACAFILGLVYTVIRVIKGTYTAQFKDIVGGILLGVPNYFSIFYLLKALRIEGLESSTLFTINNVGVVVLTTLFGVVLFKEKLTLKNWMGITISIISILLVGGFMDIL